MEWRLLKGVINPAVVLVLATGLTLAFLAGFWRSPWLQAKFALVLGLAALNGYFARCVRTFAADENRPLATIFRILNEVPAALTIGIVALVVVIPLRGRENSLASFHEQPT